MIVHGRSLMVSERDVYILADALRTWRAAHERYGARQKLAAVLPVLNEWEQIASQYGARLAAQAGSGTGRVRGTTPANTGKSDVSPISTAAAGERLGVSDRQVRRLVSQGDLEATTVGRALLVDTRSVEQLRQLREAS